MKVCQQCGEEITEKNRKVFCSEACKTEKYKERYRSAPVLEDEKRTCATLGCEKTFVVSVTSVRKYCSDACRGKGIARNGVARRRIPFSLTECPFASGQVEIYTGI